MPRVITLSGLRGTSGVCDQPYMERIIVDGKEYCRSTETGRIYDPATGAEAVGATGSSRLLNYAISAGVGALVGLMVASSKSKRLGMRALGAGVGGLAGAALLAITWPKKEA